MINNPVVNIAKEVLAAYNSNFESSLTSSLNTLKTFNVLSSLKNIGGDFEANAFTFSLNTLESFEGLENLQTIGGKKLTITNCGLLNNIDALAKVESIDEISITGCSNLYDFCVLKNVVQNMSGSFYVATCGYNPTKYQLLNGACSQTPPDNNNN